MSARIPLQTLSTSSARAAPQDLVPRTPRTPHSRMGRAEEGFTAVELDDGDDDQYRAYTAEQQQNEPLLRSATDASFPSAAHRPREEDAAARPSVLSRALWKVVGALDWLRRTLGLAGGVLAASGLLILVYLLLEPPARPAYSGIPANASAGEGMLSYANYTHFPLAPAQYAAECHKMTGGLMPPMGFWDTGPDVAHAPNPSACDASITYMLDGSVGLLAHLNLMAQVAGLAREFNRSFLVDDRNWDRGRWIDHFEDVRETQPGLQPRCVVPLEEMVACPRSARHWVITARTAKYHLAHGFVATFEDPYARGLNRAKPIYERARDSFALTIIPSARTRRLIRAARSELASMLPEGAAYNGSYVGVHVRRGRAGSAFEWGRQPVPVGAFAGPAARLIGEPGSASKVVYLASDDAGVLEELQAQLPPEASVLGLPNSAVLWLREIASQDAYKQTEFEKLTEAERARLTEGMVVDFALLSGMWPDEDLPTPHHVVCSIASGVCKASALALGFDGAFGEMDAQGEIDETKARWVDVDERGNVVPEWAAFELFN